MQSSQKRCELQMNERIIFPPFNLLLHSIAFSIFYCSFSVKNSKKCKEIENAIDLKTKKKGNHSGGKTNAMFIFYINSFDI